MLGLMLGATLFAAACDDSTQPAPPPPAITLNLVPDAVTLNIGQTVTLVAVISNTTNQAANFTSSNPAVATVNATTGVVTAVAAGTTVITATAAADANARDASTVTVNPAAPPPPPATISIKSVTTGNLLTPVNPSNVFGQIDVTLNVEIPTGNTSVQRVETLLDGNVVCSQAFSSSGSITVEQDETDAADEIVCPIPTNAFATATGIPTYTNGSHSLTARLVGTGGAILTSTPSFALFFNNTNFVNVVFSGQRSANSASGPRSIAPAGSQWFGGDLTASITSVNYGAAANAVTSLTISMTSSGQGVTGVAGCVVPVSSSLSNSLIDPTISSTDGGAGAPLLPSCAPATVTKTVTATSPLFTVVFPANANMGNGGVQNVEDVFNPGAIVVNSVTSGGGAGPTCINPTPQLNPQGVGCGTFFPSQVRVDNLAPRVTQLNIIRPNQYFNRAFVPSHLATGGAGCTAGTPCARTVDYGVDNQTASGNTKFFAGTSSSTLVDVTAGFTPLPETAVATTNLFQMVTMDALTNARTVYATTVSTTTSTSATSASDQLFGIDATAPTQAVTGPPDQSTNCPVAPSDPTTCAGQTGWTVAFSDTGVGPSGFNVNPVSIKLERLLSTGTTCYDGAGAPLASCPTSNNGFIADDGVVPLGAADGYYRLTVFVTDAAGNVSTTQTIVTLRDYTPPVAGGIASPASIAGGAAVTFSSALTDNVELGDVLGATVYGASGYVLVDSRQSIGTYGPDAFTTTSPGTFNVAFFVKSVETTDAAGVPTGTVSPASAFEYAARDVAGTRINNDFADGCPPAGAADGTTTQNCILRNVNISAAVALANPTFPGYPAANPFVHGAPNNPIVCTDGTCPTTLPTPPNTTTLSATITGPAAVFNNPFGRGVFFYMQDAQGRWVPLSTTAASVSATDNTVLNIRTWSYTFVWDPANNLPNGAVNIVAVGINSSGSALISQPQVVTLTNT
jgi:hypothetical protein